MAGLNLANQKTEVLQHLFSVLEYKYIIPMTPMRKHLIRLTVR